MKISRPLKMRLLATFSLSPFAFTSFVTALAFTFAALARLLHLLNGLPVVCLLLALLLLLPSRFLGAVIPCPDSAVPWVPVCTTADANEETRLTQVEASACMSLLYESNICAVSPY